MFNIENFCYMTESKAFITSINWVILPIISFIRDTVAYWMLTTQWFSLLKAQSSERMTVKKNAKDQVNCTFSHDFLI